MYISNCTTLMLNSPIFLLIFLVSLVLSAQSTSDSSIKNTEEKVDSILTTGIQNQAFPGANILVAYKGQVIFHKTYGFHTYDSLVPVQPDDLYDLASVTKILGPLPALMKLVGDKKLDLDRPFSSYWKPWRKYKDKKDLTLREILAHQAGLRPYIVFLNKVLRKNGELKQRFIRAQPSSRFQKQVYEGLYVKNRFEKKVFRHINRSKVSPDKTYNYSGLTFLVFPKLIEQITGKDYEAYLTEELYRPIGAVTLGFNPLKNGKRNPIVPTENDTLFRHALTKGWVHDENAALLGGVSGNAGLFGTATDVLKMMQLYQNFGEFDGKRLLKKETVKEFIKIQYPENDNRRGLGFDKPLIGNDTLLLSEAYPAPRASPQSFGHAGFTGTFVWADPEHELIFIFLSNRVHPTRENRGLYLLNIRPKLHQLFYSALID